MPRVAIFVDAGYLFAQGSQALAGDKQPRAKLTLDVSAAIAELERTMRSQGVKLALLRTYWYDGARGSGVLPSDHAEIARTPFVKLRLGMINGAGQQKGVDSLIVTDLIELARNRAIDDAVLLSGDDDIRVGVTIAQAFGVCVHLIGIAPSIGSQSPLLMQEADTTTEWGQETVSRFLSIKVPTPHVRPRTVPPDSPDPPLSPDASEPSPAGIEVLETTIRDFVAQLPATETITLRAFWMEGGKGVPSDIDRTLLATCRNQLQRKLGQTETRQMRDLFTRLVGPESSTAQKVQDKP